MRGDTLDLVAAERSEIAEADGALKACFDCRGFIGRFLRRERRIRARALTTQEAKDANATDALCQKAY